MKSREGDVGYFEVNAVFNGEPVDLLEESTWTARSRRTVTTRPSRFCAFNNIHMITPPSREAEYCDERLCVCVCLRYDARCYFNVRSKADISQLNLPHGTDN